MKLNAGLFKKSREWKKDNKKQCELCSKENYSAKTCKSKNVIQRQFNDILKKIQNKH